MTWKKNVFFLFLVGKMIVYSMCDHWPFQIYRHMHTNEHNKSREKKIHKLTVFISFVVPNKLVLWCDNTRYSRFFFAHTFPSLSLSVVRLFVCPLTRSFLFIYIWPSIVFSFAHSGEFICNEYFCKQFEQNEQLLRLKWVKKNANEKNESQRQIYLRRAVCVCVCFSVRKKKPKMNYGFCIPFTYFPIGRMKRSALYPVHERMKKHSTEGINNLKWKNETNSTAALLLFLFCFFTCERTVES